MARGTVTRSERQEPYAEAAGRKGAGISIPARARAHATESLFRNIISQFLNLAITAGCGYGGLVLLTHLYSVQAVGLSAAAVSACSLVTAFTQFGTDYSLSRYLPASKNKEDLINTLHTIILASTPVAAAIFLVLPLSRQLYGIGRFFVPAFIAATTLQAVITFLGLVLVSQRASGTVAKASFPSNLTKLGAPAFFTAGGILGAFLARTISNLVSWIALVFVLVRRGHRFRLVLRFSAVRELARFSLGMYVASTIGGITPLLLPIIVLSRLGAHGTAFWSIAYTVAMLLYLLPSAVTQALLPEISSRPADRRSLLRKASLLIVGLVFPALAIAYALAPVALTVFGHQYASDALTALHWLIAAGFMSTINYIPGAILFLAKKSRAVVLVNVINAAIVLGLAAAWATNPKQVAIAWFAGGVVNTALFGSFAWLALREVRYRFQDLGGDQQSQASPVVIPDTMMPSSLQQAFDVLADIAARQRLAGTANTTGSLTRAFSVLAAIGDLQREVLTPGPSRYHQMTEPQGLYSVLMLQEAERARASAAAAGTTPVRQRPPAR